MTDLPISARGGSVAARLIHWLRSRYFTSLPQSVTIVVLSLAGLALFLRLFDWAIVNAVWVAPPGDAGPCRDNGPGGACWAFVGEKYRFMLFATYPFEEHWRPAGVCAILFLLYAFSAVPRFWTRWLLLMWPTGLVAVLTLMRGGIAGLSQVPTESWGGLPVTLLLATFGIMAALPFGTLVALGRQANELPAIRLMCIVYVELIRGVPLVSLLFMASFVFPLFLPQGIDTDKLLRAQIALILFSAAYIAEVVRGGLQGVSRGQYEGATALGLGYWKTRFLVVLPQALRIALPSLVNTAISIFKSTSLVMVVGVFDLLSAGKAAIVDPVWQGFGLEMFLSVSAIYFVFCYAMSRYSRFLERRVAP